MNKKNISRFLLSKTLIIKDRIKIFSMLKCINNIKTENI